MFMGRRYKVTCLAAAAGMLLLGSTSMLLADVPGRVPLASGHVAANPGTQELDLPNLSTAIPAAHNVFEPGTECAKCHSGTIDRAASHFGNWAGTNMASAGRDPVFRANQIRVNQAIEAATGLDGAGNVCFRCHSPNGWHSGRLNPALGGKGDGSRLIHDKMSAADASDEEGVLCEMCHRTLAAVRMPSGGLALGPVHDPFWGATAHPYGYSDSAFNMLAGMSDWPHLGDPYPFGPLPGEMMGDATLQINGRAPLRGGKYTGSVTVHWSDVPIPGTSYTGQTYAVYPPGHPQAGMPQVLPDGTVPLHYEHPVLEPTLHDAISPEHSTYKSDFLRSSEFCGACHDLTIPVLNHGMPEQRTYTEWRFSQYARMGVQCQNCHMPTLRHEYSDSQRISLNCDPAAFPDEAQFAKDRNADGGTTFHKFGGANRDLPGMMKVLYPDVDLASLAMGASVEASRSLSWDTAARNTDVNLQRSARIEVIKAASTGPRRRPTAEVKVKVTNLAGHRIPSGYPDGRRLWIELVAKDQAGQEVYRSGFYDPATARLYTDSAHTPLVRAQKPSIYSRANAVMVYERRTAMRDHVTGIVDPNHENDLLNNIILFDNRLPPAGFSNADYSRAGTKFMNYDPKTFEPYEEPERYADGQNYDIVTYRFPVSPGTKLSVQASLYVQTHTREFMEFLKVGDTSTLRPEGPTPPYTSPDMIVPNYLSDVINLPAITDLDGAPLRDNWGGIAYASWILSGKGAPFLISRAQTPRTAVTAPVLTVTPAGPATVNLQWMPVPAAVGYVVWVRYGIDPSTSSWDAIAVVHDATAFLHQGLKPGKTYAWSVDAFNAEGKASSAVVTATAP